MWVRGGGGGCGKEWGGYLRHDKVKLGEHLAIKCGPGGGGG